MDIFVARQPILDVNQDIFAYELLYRDGTINAFCSVDGDTATTKVVAGSFIVFSIQSIVGEKKAFINFTRKFFTNNFATLLPKQRVVLEILENIEPDEIIIQQCLQLKKKGYILALDDFVYDPKYDILMDIVDFIKVDIIETPLDKCRPLLKKYLPKGIKFVAEKVETKQEFRKAKKMGFEYFQGFFFQKPEVLHTKDIPVYKTTYLNLMREMLFPELDFIHLEKIVTRDVSIAHKLLKVINSAYFGLRHKVVSIKQALVLLGEVEIKKWGSLILMSEIGDDKPNELITNSICRARFCELLAPYAGLKNRSEDLYLLGLFSLMDSLMDAPIEDLVSDLPLEEDIKQALQGEENAMLAILRIVIAFETADWDLLNQSISGSRIPESALPKLYVDSIEFTNQIFN